jgi:hypothetical protein
LQHKDKTVKPSAALDAPTRAATRTRVATWASSDVLPALSRRAEELEGLAKSLQADLDRATARLAAYSEFDATLEQALVDAFVGAEEIQQEARVEADATLERALDHRRLVLMDIGRLRSERDDVTDEIAFGRRRRFLPVRALPETADDPVPDHRAALAAEMRMILTALLRESLGPRPALIAPTTAVRPPSTLLRAPVPPARTRREPTPPRDVTPTPTTPATGGPKAEDPIEDRLLQETARAEEIAETIASLVATDTELVQEIAVVIETSTDLSGASAQQTTEPTASTFDEVETPVLAPSENVGAVTEPDHAATDHAVEADGTTEDLRAVALKLVATSSAPTPEISLEIGPGLEIGPDLPPEVSQDESTIGHAEPSEGAPDVNIAQQMDVAAPIETEVVENVALLPPPLVAEPELVTPREADAITDLWETALGVTRSGQERSEPSLAPLSSPGEMAAEAPTQTHSLITESAPNVDAPPLKEQAKSASPIPPPVVAPRRAVRELQLVLSPITSFPQLLAIQHRIASLSSVNALQLRDFRNGVATFAAGVTDALSGREFGSVLQKLVDLQLRLEGATEDGVELRVDPQVP